MSRPVVLAVCVGILGCRPAPPVEPTPVVQPPEPEAAEPEPAERSACRVDFDEMRRLVETSYAGYEDKVARLGSTRVFDLADSIAGETDAIEQEADPRCTEALRRYLEAFEDGHLGLIDRRASETKAEEAPSKPREPSFVRVSARIVVLELPSFADPAAVDAIVDEHRLEIRRSEHLILDLRGNGGGADRSYRSLMKYFYGGPFTVVGVDVLATEDNAAAWERIVSQMPKGLDDVKAQVRQTVELMRAHPGEFVALAADRTVELPEVLPLPRTVSVFYDRGCASSCEQFLLAARQSDKVTTFGEPSAGVLDYSNVRFAQLPSKQRALAWATTRSRRLPDEPVDGVGIAPDVRVDAETLGVLDPAAMARLVARPPS